jgi:hypothetical protein
LAEAAGGRDYAGSVDLPEAGRGSVLAVRATLPRPADPHPRAVA